MKKLFNVLLAVVFFYGASVVAEQALPLFNAYPDLLISTSDKPKIDHLFLAQLPTPVQKLESLGLVYKAPNIWIKRDDLTGDLFGGNKVRKLEFLLGQAKAQKAKGVVTVGFAGSNHTTATALYAQKHGLDCFCLHTPQMVTVYFLRNIRLSALANAHLYHFNSVAERDAAKQEIFKAYEETTGTPLYFIPSGGSNGVGALGFVNAAFELKEQVDSGLIPEPDYIYVACGSTATAAGLMLGCKVAGLKTKVVPICIEPSKPGAFEEKLARIYNEASEYLHLCDHSFPLLVLAPEDIEIDYNFRGEKYAAITQKAYDAIKIVAEKEGVKLDGTYAGKACAAMLSDIKTKKLEDKVILFWNTFYAGECKDRVDAIDYTKLPHGYHDYFKTELQTRDQGV